MKTVLYISLIFCLQYLPTAAQSYSYRYDNKEGGISNTYKNLDFNIYANYYELQYQYTTSGGGCAQIYSELISYGFVMRFKNTLILHDVKGSYNMKVMVTDTTLKVIKGFEGFKEIEFKGYGYPIKSDRWTDSFAVRHEADYLNRSMVPDSLVYSGLLCKGKKRKTFYQFKFCTDEGKKYYSAKDETSMVFKGKNYEYRMYDFLFTKGSWSRVGNYIILKDASLGAYFICRLIGDNHLKTLVFPFTDHSLEFMLQ